MRIGWILFILAFLIRIILLTMRPLHHDESVNGWFVDQVLHNGFYKYDPSNYHGPMYFYVLTLFQIIFGRSEWVLRLPTVIAGSYMVTTPLLFRRWWKGKGMVWASVGLMVSAGSVFFNRYAIHETFFTLSTVLFLYMWFRLLDEPGARWAIFLGIVFGCMVSLKENFVLYGAAFLAAELILYRGKNLLTVAKNFHWILIGFLPVWFLFFSGFGRDMGGLERFFTAFLDWSNTGSNGNGHQKAFYYFFELLIKYEWWMVVGIPAGIFGLFIQDKRIQTLSIITLGTLLIYSIVPYKTPWCILSFLPFLSMCVGIIVDRFSKDNRVKGVLGALLVASAIGMTIPVYFTVENEDYMYFYGHTYGEFIPPVEEILDYYNLHPEQVPTLKMAVVSDTTWPLPWYLGELHRVGYYGSKNIPPNVFDNDILIIDEKVLNAIGLKRTPIYRTKAKIRPWAGEVEFLWFTNKPR